MHMKKSHWLAILLLISGLILSSLVPGGPIENRQFSHINPAVLLTFNVYLTLLGLGSFLLFIHVLRQGRFAGPLSLLAGLSYLLVYAIDLLGWFPQSPSPMSNALLWSEIIGVIIALPMIQLALSYSRESAHTGPNNQTNNQMNAQANTQPDIQENTWRTSRLQLALLVLLAIGIVTFATWSAMTPAS